MPREPHAGVGRPQTQVSEPEDPEESRTAVEEVHAGPNRSQTRYMECSIWYVTIYDIQFVVYAIVVRIYHMVYGVYIYTVYMRIL